MVLSFDRQYFTGLYLVNLSYRISFRSQTFDHMVAIQITKIQDQIHLFKLFGFSLIENTKQDRIENSHFYYQSLRHNKTFSCCLFSHLASGLRHFFVFPLRKQGDICTAHIIINCKVVLSILYSQAKKNICFVLYNSRELSQ